MTFPVRTVTVPAVLNGKQNGKLPDSILLDTPGLAGGPTVRLVAPAARAWRALTAAATVAGHTLKASSLVDSYRPYDVQLKIFLKRFSTQPVSSTKRYWNGKAYYLIPGNALAAVPGTSNHGRGLAVDVGVELDGDTGTESIDAKTLAWLVANEERFGFSHEVQPEPWHIRYFTGDHVPAAVLDYEAKSSGGALMAVSDKDWDNLVAKVDDLVEQVGLIFTRGFGLAPQDKIPEGDRGLIERRVSRLFFDVADIKRDVADIRAKVD